jgi:glycosyltransferase involved in cell wall biosynthesis
MYSGNMGLGHDLESMVDAASRLEQDSRAHFMFIGAGPKWEIVEKSVQEQRLANVTMLGWQDESVLPYSLATADVGLVSLEQELSGLAVPSKAFYFLAAHVPLIAVCDEETELAKIVQEFGCGVVVPPQHPDRIVEVIESIQADPGIIETWRESAKTAMKSFQRSGATRRFAELLHRDLGTPLAPAVEGSDSPVVDPIPTTIQ